MDAAQAEALILSGPEGVARWNQIRRDGVATPMVFQLAYPYAEGTLDLRGIDLGGCVLKGSRLSDVDFTGAHLYQTDFSDCHLDLADFGGAHLRGARFSGARLQRCRFNAADMEESLFDGVTGNASFAGARLARADFSHASLELCDFSHAELLDACFRGAHLHGVHFFAADMLRADLSDIRDSSIHDQSTQDSKTTGNDSQSGDGSPRVNHNVFDRADLSDASLMAAELNNASFVATNLCRANLGRATLRGARFDEARMIGTRIEAAMLSDCSVYGVSAWDIATDGETRQHALSIGPADGNPIWVDDLEVAQFMYLLLNNARLRGVIDTITSRVVLILGRFSPERKPVLDSLRVRLAESRYGLVPVMFDFEGPSSRSTMETVKTLAGMARLIVADLSDPACVFGELSQIVPDYPSVPVLPLLADGQPEPGMWDFIRKYPWVMSIHRYRDRETLLAEIDGLLEPVLAGSKERSDRES